MQQNAEKKDKFSPDTPLFEELTNVKKKTDKFNLYLNMQGSFDAHFRDGFQEGDFNMHQLRIEAKGNINNWLSYRYRQRLNRSNDANGMIDNLPTFYRLRRYRNSVKRPIQSFCRKTMCRIRWFRVRPEPD